MKSIKSDKKYRIVAYGPGKECLTWAGVMNLEWTKEYLRLEGYDTFDIKEERDGE